MLFPPLKGLACRTLIAAALVAGSLPGCHKPKEPAAAAAKPAAAESLPRLSSVAEVKAAQSKAGNRMVVIDFYADWCRPCRALAPVMRELADEHKGKTDFYRANIDGNAELADAFGIRGIPHVVFMKNDSVVFAVTGLNPKERYAEIVTVCERAGSAAECIKWLKDEE